MGREYRVRIRGKQRAEIEVDLMAHLVVLMGRHLAELAAQSEHDSDEQQTGRPAPEADRPEGEPSTEPVT
jgi:hypothetical protein